MVNFKYCWVYADLFFFFFFFWGGGGVGGGVNSRCYGHAYIKKKKRVPPCAGKTGLSLTWFLTSSQRNRIARKTQSNPCAP